MSFRQHNKDPDTAWRRKLRGELLATGLPDFIIDDDRRWNYVLLHDYDPESGWNPSWITKEQARDLLQLLRSHYEQSTALWLFDSLEKRYASQS
jgi:hypothetical protein